jgi:2-polyprenyl-6-methoxyphenol hydroxylase-like FAD-dependent oxidoreductase
VVVGASLAGLCTALALARRQWSVTVLERSSTPGTGMGLAVDVPLLHAVTGLSPSQVPVISAGYTFTGWGLLHDALAAAAADHPQIDLRYGSAVSSVRTAEGEGSATVATSAGNLGADLVVGADGYNSRVRRALTPAEPTATYSGFVLWRGLLQEESVPGGFGDAVGLDFKEGDGGVLATFAIPGSDGSITPGHRRGVYTWFDASRDADMTTAGVLEGDTVLRSWSGVDVPADLIADLSRQARRWRSPWNHAITHTLGQRHFIGTPVAEYLPTRLARGRIALVGDAAHVVSPVTGAGFHNGLLDIEALIAALHVAPDVDVVAALQAYDHQRLPLARALVSQSQAWSSAFRKAS